MLSPKEISDLFEVQINTLYNWRKSKPKLYAYLQNADYNLEINNEINILLDFYSKTISKNFTLKEIEFLISSEYELNSINEVSNYESMFIKTNYKLISSNPDLVLGIYDKIKPLNIVEKYILYKKVYKIRLHSSIHLKTLFQEFLEKDH